VILAATAGEPQIDSSGQMWSNAFRAARSAQHHEHLSAGGGRGRSSRRPKAGVNSPSGMQAVASAVMSEVGVDFDQVHFAVAAPAPRLPVEFL